MSFKKKMFDKIVTILTSKTIDVITIRSQMNALAKQAYNFIRWILMNPTRAFCRRIATTHHLLNCTPPHFKKQMKKKTPTTIMDCVRIVKLCFFRFRFLYLYLSDE